MAAHVDSSGHPRREFGVESFPVSVDFFAAASETRTLPRGASLHGTVMNPYPATVSPETPLTRVLEQMVESRHRSFPVVEGGTLVGVISREDVARALHRAAESDKGVAAHSSSVPNA